MTAPALSELEELLGPGTVSGGRASGEPGPVTVRPDSVKGVSSVLALANARGWAVLPRGNGTKLGWGGPVTACDLVLDTTGLDQLVEHEPGDLICVAGAGMTLGRLQQIVSEAPGYRQRLMLDPPQGARATLGGLVATRASGPLRTRYGTMRDLLLGAQFVLADGTVARTGGKVVKNVAGYDLDKLLVGSLGGLAVLVELALRLHPVPSFRTTVFLEEATPERAASFLTSLRKAPAAPSVAEVLWPERSLLVQFDSSQQGAQRQAELVAAIDPGARLLDPAEAAHRETALSARPWEMPGVVAGLALPLSRIPALLHLADALERQGVGFSLSLRGTVGVGEIRLPPDEPTIAQFRSELESIDGHLEIHRAEGHLGELGSGTSDPVSRSLAAAVKRALDPRGILAPGRLERISSVAPSGTGDG
ncbi:MAG: FAD-binding oxidoreductase [Candidatus Dormibacteria bacterium]